MLRPGGVPAGQFSRALTPGRAVDCIRQTGGVIADRRGRFGDGSLFALCGHIFLADPPHPRAGLQMFSSLCDASGLIAGVQLSRRSQSRWKLDSERPGA